MNFARFSSEIQFKIPNYQFFTTIIWDEFGMICTTRWCNFVYLIVIILESHIYDATFWTRNETWHKPIFFIFKKSQYLILKIHTAQMIISWHKNQEKFGWMRDYTGCRQEKVREGLQSVCRPLYGCRLVEGINWRQSCCL